MRQNIDRNPRRIKTVLMDAGMRREFLQGAPKQEAKAVKAFISSDTNADNALKTKPKVSHSKSLLFVWVHRDIYTISGSLPMRLVIVSLS